MYLRIVYEDPSLAPLAKALQENYQGLIRFSDQAGYALVLGQGPAVDGQVLTLVEGPPQKSTKQVLYVENLPRFFDQASAILALNKRLFALQQDWLAGLPYLLRMTDAENHLIYSNNRPTFPFDFDPETAADYALSDWQQALLAEKSWLIESVPTAAADQFLVQVYQSLLSPSGEFLGVLEQVQDILPLIRHYLTETNQALVGLSDTTSGASVTSSEDDLF